MKKYAVLFSEDCFILSHSVETLTNNGFCIAIFSQNPRDMNSIRAYNKPGKVLLFNIKDHKNISFHLSKCDVAINFNVINVEHSKSKQNFKIALTKYIFETARQNKTKQFIHCSYMHSERNKNSKFIKFAINCENIAKQEFSGTIIIRSDLIFSNNMLAKELYNILKTAYDTNLKNVTLFKPVYIHDLVQLIIKVTKHNLTTKKTLYNAFGNRAYSIESLKEAVIEQTNLKHEHVSAFLLGAKLNQIAKKLKSYLSQLTTQDKVDELGFTHRYCHKNHQNSISNDIEGLGINITKRRDIANL